MTRIVLEAPAFHQYGASIAGALRRRGHEVHLHAYDANLTLRSKARTKFLHELPRKLGIEAGERHRRTLLTASAAAVVRAERPDVVITVKGDQLGSEYWEAVDDSGARQLLWLYDELSRMRFDDQVLTSRPSIVSYSPHDVVELARRGLRAAHVLDAFDHTIPFSPVPSDDVVFVGARYPDRERLLTHLHRSGVSVKVFGRDWSGHPVDRLRTWRLRSPDLPAGRDVPRGVAYGITAGAAAAINSHTDQDGFTMRTYEIPGSGGLQLIDRSDVDQIYEPEREILVFSCDAELVDLCQRARVDRTWAARIAAEGQGRTLAEHTFDHRIPLLEEAWD